jgi:Zn-finger nucleic acid-binding protein
MELLLDAHGLEEAKTFLDGIRDAAETASTEKKRKCPICRRKMKKVAIGEPETVLIDACDREHGLWFDGGEISQMVRHLAGKHLAEDGAREAVINFIEEIFGAAKAGEG